VWSEAFESDTEARSALEQLRGDRTVLTGAVVRSLQASRVQHPDYDPWRDLTDADVTLLTTTRPGVVARAYRDARAKGAGGFPAEAAANQLQLYRDL
jgi:hypothetical protein